MDTFIWPTLCRSAYLLKAVVNEDLDALCNCTRLIRGLTSVQQHHTWVYFSEFHRRRLLSFAITDGGNLYFLALLHRIYFCVKSDLNFWIQIRGPMLQAQAVRFNIKYLGFSFQYPQLQSSRFPTPEYRFQVHIYAPGWIRSMSRSKLQNLASSIES